jgi:hypothetical protein
MSSAQKQPVSPYTYQTAAAMRTRLPPPTYSASKTNDPLLLRSSITPGQSANPSFVHKGNGRNFNQQQSRTSGSSSFLNNSARKTVPYPVGVQQSHLGIRGTFGSSGASSIAKPPLKNPPTRTNFEYLQKKAAADFEKNF